MLGLKFFKRGTQIIATIDIVTSVLTFVSIFFLVYLTVFHGDRLEVKVERDQNKHPELAALFALGRGPFVLIMLLFMSICLGYFYLARHLLHAANERSYKRIHRWCTITLVIIIIRAAFFITAVVFTTSDRVLFSSFGIIGFLYQIFCLWFVRTFVDKLRNDGLEKIIQFSESITTNQSLDEILCCGHNHYSQSHNQYPPDYPCHSHHYHPFSIYDSEHVLKVDETGNNRVPSDFSTDFYLGPLPTSDSELYKNSFAKNANGHSGSSSCHNFHFKT